MFKPQTSTFSNGRNKGSSGDATSQTVMLYPQGGYQMGSALLFRCVVHCLAPRTPAQELASNKLSSCGSKALNSSRDSLLVFCKLNDELDNGR